MLLDHFGVTSGERTMASMTPARIAALPAAAQPHVRTLRAHHEAVQQAMRRAEPGHVGDALAFASRAWRRPLTLAEQQSPARVLPHVAQHAAPRSRRGDPGAPRAHPDVAVVPLSPRGITSPHRDEAGRLGDRQPAQLLPVVVDSGRRAAAGGGGGRAARSAGDRPAGPAHDGRPEGPAPLHRVLRPVARLLPFRSVPRRGHGPLPRVHRRGQARDVRRGRLDLRVHRSRRAPREGDPPRRLRVREPAAGEVLRDRRARDVCGASAARGRRPRVRPWRRAAARRRADHDVGAAPDESRSSAATGSCGAFSARRRRRRPPTPARCPPTTRASRARPCGSAWHSTRTVRSAPRVTCGSTRSASRSRPSMPSAAARGLRRRQAGRRDRRVQGRARRSSGPRACSRTCSRRTPR